MLLDWWNFGGPAVWWKNSMFDILFNLRKKCICYLQINVFIGPTVQWKVNKTSDLVASSWKENGVTIL